MSKPDLKDVLVERVLKEIFKLIEKSGSLQVETKKPKREFDLTELEGGYEGTVYDLVNQMLYQSGSYVEVLNAEGISKVEANWSDGYSIPSLDEEDYLDGINFRMDEIENSVIAGVAIYAKDNGYDYSNFLDYYESYGDDEMVEKLYD